MTEPIDASTRAGDDARSTRKPAEGDDTSHLLSARGFSAIMHRETMIRASLRPPRPGDKGALLGGLYLAPNMRRALAALLRGEPVTAQERAALAHAASLLPADEPTVPAPPASPAGVWAGMIDAANSNNAVPATARGLFVPILPNRVPEKDEDEDKDKDDNYVLRELGLNAEDPEGG